MKNFFMEKVQINKEPAGEGRYKAKSVRIIGEDEKSFYGGLIAERGAEKGKAFMFKENEEISVGSGDDDVYIIGAIEKETFCMIRYDGISGEYLVTPLKKKAVFLGSMQPLGKDRTYNISRGKQLVIDSKKNVFTLA